VIARRPRRLRVGARIRILEPNSYVRYLHKQAGTIACAHTQPYCFLLQFDSPVFIGWPGADLKMKRVIVDEREVGEAFEYVR
jgi:hypothetical protein